MADERSTAATRKTRTAKALAEKTPEEKTPVTKARAVKAAKADASAEKAPAPKKRAVKAATTDAAAEKAPATKKRAVKAATTDASVEKAPATKKRAAKAATADAAAEKAPATKTRAVKTTVAKEPAAKTETQRKGKENPFDLRLARHIDELRWLYLSLYGGNEQAFAYFLSMLRRMFDERRAELRRLDSSRERRPDWYRGNKLLGMMAYTGAFAGTLNGVREKLDYVQECGVNYLHLMPLLQSPEGRSDGGYAVADFRRVQPELGTMDDLRELADACHRDGISLCLDFVMNHTSEDHEWAKRARAGEQEYRDRYFFYDNWDIPDWYNSTCPQVFPTTAPGNFTWLDDCQKVVMTTFYPYQWDLNYANPTVFNDMTENLLYLANQGVDVIRLDAVPYIWKQLGTTCRNLPQVHTLCRLMRMTCEIVCPGVLLLGEVVMEPARVAPYFGTVEKPECHMLYNVTTMASMWNTLATHDVRLLRMQMNAVFRLPKDYVFLNYLRCHDDIGWGLDYGFLGQFGVEEVSHKRFLNDYFRGYTYESDSRAELYNDDPRLGDARLCGTTASLCGLETAQNEQNADKLERSLRCDEMLHAFMLTQSGIPVLYSGDEIGQLNDNAYHEDPNKRDDSRYLHRGDFRWDDAAKRDDPTTVQGRLFGALRKLEKLRARQDVFKADADCYVYDMEDTNILGIVRIREGVRLLAFFNFSGYEKTIPLGVKAGRKDLVAGVAFKQTDVQLAPYGYCWLLEPFEEER